uniref:Uncharacterized protein AlNc14C18G1922 n=1 Tax=Albugo laibachii Nc14 TaxID=890382 RepID=F0W4V2_9STRA|nr:conserved hypothetical protein [Albugo laibachii Nc14]CCA25101.1 conserved hypothetical protein [Albugo laibachii Nc14]|eukprot:CCA25101.1 conserved hypothetical protein [Albugo laibachii Nc14]
MSCWRATIPLSRACNAKSTRHNRAIVTRLIANSTSRRFASNYKNKSDNADFELTLRALRGVPPENPKPFTEEEKEQHRIIGHRYNRMTSIKHNHWQRDLQTKIDLKWKAINALPKELQEEALQEDYDPIPPGSYIPSWTPPIKGFRLKDQAIELREEYND